MAFDVFISHSSTDKEAAYAVCAGLESAGFKCWIAPRNVVGGLDYADQISEAILECPATVIIFSKHANDSRHVKAEIDAAFGSGKLLVPLRIDDVEPTKGMSHYLRNTHWLRAKGKPANEDIASVVETLKRLLPERAAGGVPSVPPASPAVSANKPKMLPILLGIILLLLVGGGAAAYFILKKPTAGLPSAAVSDEAQEDSPEYQAALGAISAAWLALGDLSGAEEALETAAWNEDRAKALAAAQLKSGNRAKALETLAGGGSPSKQDLYDLVILEARNGAVKQAYSSLLEVEKTGPEDIPAAEARIEILQASATASSAFQLDQETFSAVLADAEELVAEDDSWDSYVRSLRIGRIKAAMEDTDGARGQIKLAEEQLSEPITDETAPVVAETLNVYVDLGDLEGARSFFGKLKIESGSDVAMLPLVNALVAGDQMEEAAKLALSGANPQSQQAVVADYLENDSIDAAVALAADPKAVGLALPVLISHAYEDTGHVKEAAEWMDKAKGVVLKRAGKFEQAGGLAEIAAIEANAGYIDAATKSIEEAEKKIGFQ